MVSTRTSDTEWERLLLGSQEWLNELEDTGLWQNPEALDEPGLLGSIS